MSGKRESMNQRRELILWEVAGWAVSFLPLLLVLLMRRDRYFTGYTGLRVGAGVTAVLVIGLLAALRKAKLPPRVLTLWGAVTVLWLLIPLLNDMLLLTCLLAVGSTLDEAVCQTRIRILRRRMERAERAEDVATGIAAAMRTDGGREEDGHAG